jgi:hypothetical protein
MSTATSVSSDCEAAMRVKNSEKKRRDRAKFL